MAPLLRGAARASKVAYRAGATGASWARRRGGEIVEQIPVERIEHDVRETVGAAQERIDGFVRHELRDLRRALRRRRKQIGI